MTKHKNYFFGYPFQWIRAVLTFVNVWRTLLTLVILCHIFGSMYVAIFYFSFFTFRDLDQAMKLLKLKPFRWTNLDKFRREHTCIVTRIFRFDNIIGNILLLFYVTNYPTNAYLLIYITRGKMSLFVLIYMIAYMLGQLVFIINIHILAASYRFDSLGFLMIHTKFVDIQIFYWNIIFIILDC